MKKILLAFLIVLGGLALSACTPKINQMPEIIGVNLNPEITEGDHYDPLEGVTAFDAEDGDLTDRLELRVYDPNRVNVPGIHTFYISVTDNDGNTMIATITLTIHPIVIVETYSLEVEGAVELSEIHSDMFDTVTLREIEVEENVVLTKTYLGYRLSDFLKNETIEGYAIENELTTTYFNLDLGNVYLIVGEKTSSEDLLYPMADYRIERIKNQIRTEQILHPTKLTLRTIDPQEAIYYINYNSVYGRYDYHTSLRELQGVINRGHPRLLTISTGNPYFKDSDTTWLSILESKGYDLIELTSLEEVLYTFKDDFQGIITFRDRFKSYNNWVSGESDFALMMGSVTDYAVIPNGLQTSMSELTGLPIIDSFELNGQTVSGDISAYLDSQNITDAYGCYEHVFNNFKEVFNQAAYMSLTSEVMDYAASEKMMFFDLKATQSARDSILSQDINSYFDLHNDYFQVYGWVDSESSALDFISKYGGVIDVVGSGNLSLLARLDIDTESFQQKAVVQAEYDPTKKYVTFFASESDTIKVGVALQHGAWLDPNRGKVPINWGLISDMSAEFRFVYDYFFETATEQDYFYSGGGSAVGFVDIDSQMSYTSRNAIADANAYYMELGDQHYIDMYNDLYTSTDVFEKSVIGSYLLRSQVDGAYARIHDGNTSIRVETWSQIPVYNRWTNYYPRRSSSSEVSLIAMDKINNTRFEQDFNSTYWFIETDMAYTLEKTGFELFRQDNGDCYSVYFEQGKIYLSKIIDGDETIVDQIVFNQQTKHVKISIDKSSPIDDYTRIKLYVNDFKVIEYYDPDNSFSSGGFALFNETSVSSTFQNLNGTRYSMAQAIYRKIISDSNRFILAYYGFVSTEEYTLAQYRTEPGIGDVISLSPTDFYKIKLMLELNYPDVYEIVLAPEFMEYALEYQQYYGTLR